MAAHPAVNAETWAQVGQLLARASGVPPPRHPAEPGTTLLTLGCGTSARSCREAAYGARLRDVLAEPARGRPALVGGFHGAGSPGRRSPRSASR